jgi:hypothetical protein
LPYDPIWDDFEIFPTDKQYVKAGQEIVLAKLTRKGLAENNKELKLEDSQISEILEAWTNQLKGITIKIAYQDVLGDKQTDCERTF